MTKTFHYGIRKVPYGYALNYTFKVGTELYGWYVPFTDLKYWRLAKKRAKEEAERWYAQVAKV